MSSIHKDTSSASNLNKRPHSLVLSKSTQSSEANVDEPSLKRQKTPDSRVPANVLPADFFGDARKATSSVIDTSITHKRISKGAQDVDGNLPNNDEWAAFEAEIAEIQNSSPSHGLGAIPSATVISAAPVLNVEHGNDENDAASTDKRISTFEVDREDAQNKLADEFEQMENLEERVRRLKAQREAIRKQAVATTLEPHDPENRAREVDPNIEEEEEDDDEDDWIHLSRG